jgi:hypothetical protein
LSVGPPHHDHGLSTDEGGGGLTDSDWGTSAGETSADDGTDYDE